MDNTKEKNKRDKRKFFRIIGILVCSLFSLVLIIVKISKPEFKIGWIILGSVGILIFGSIMWFWNNLVDMLKRAEKLEKEKKLPTPKETKEIIPLCQDTIMNTRYTDMAPYPNDDSCIRSVGENPSTQIYEYKAPGLYTNRNYVILMNMHYPEKFQVLIDPSAYKITLALNSLAEKKDKIPDEEEIRTKNDLTGTEQTIKRKTYSKNEEKKDDKEENKLI